ncbi:bifunctional DNA primase/polymerase [Saccharopolyspora sp. SCSIO 74807]|uniref:bifunctional DNA primase/polymerase n=1 Tax=Saccharopolyspora sp. SCSIO 74807 TaxID=3118084 RepID=UPI0030D4CAB5
MTTSFDRAAWFARHGLHVFPLRPSSKKPFGNCLPCKADQCTPSECRCRTAVRPCHGYLAATTNPAMLRRWWTHTPRANVGISTGPSGLVVLDLDRKPKTPQPATHDVPTLAADGLEALHALTAAEGVAWPETLTIETPSGGRHLYFRAPNGLEVTSDATGRVGHQIDLRAHGGYVVAPGSEITAPPEDSSGRYARVSHAVDIAPLPDWLRPRVAPPKPVVVPRKAPNLARIRAGNHSPGYWRQIWEDELSKVETRDGERWKLLYASARRLANLATHDTAPWDEHEAIDALVNAALRRRHHTGKPLEETTARKNASRGWRRGTQDGPDSLHGLSRTA